MITTINKISFLKNFLIICVITIEWICPTKTFALNFLNNQTIKIYLQYKQFNIYPNDSTNKKFTTNILLQSKIFNSIYEKIIFNCKIKNNFFDQTIYSRNKQKNITVQYININQNIYFHILIQKPLQIIDYQLINLSKKLLKYKKNKILITNKSSQLFLQKPSIIKYVILYNLKQKKIISTKINIIDLLKKFQHFILKIEKINKLKYIQTNINNQKKLPQFTISFQNIYNYTDETIHTLQTIIHTETILLNQNNLLPKSIQNQLNINYNLSSELTQQKYYINEIKFRHQETIKNISQVRQTFTKLLEQTQWLEKSTALKEILRAQISKLPNTPNFQQLNNNIKKLQKTRFQYENQIKKLPLLLLKSRQDNNDPLTLSQKCILKKQLAIQNDLIISLLNNYDIQILELTKLKFSYETLQKSLQEIKKAMHRYLFWVADTYPITTSYLLDIYQDFYKLFTEDKLKQQIVSTLTMIYSSHTILILIICSIITSIGLYVGTHQYYQEFLERSSKHIGKVNQDNFLITFHNIWYSMIMALPIPLFWFTIGYILDHAWEYPIIVSIGKGIKSTTLMLWISIISFYFASSKGLFIIHFGWPKRRIQKVFSRYYILSISTIILLTMSLIIFNDYNERKFYPTLGRLCFILLCIYLTYITKNLKNSKLPLYINKYDSSDNIINYFLWNIIICAPIIASIACILGYFFVAQELLMRLEISLFIWIVLLIVYHLVRRWISIQRRRIAFERAKQKRAQKLALRTHNELNFIQYHIPINNKLESNKNNKKNLDLDTINTQSLQLIRSITTLIAILLMTLLWSELHSAFYFLENITLWDVTSTIKGVNNIQPITLNSFLIAVLVIIITTKTVHNLPAFLELTLLQHLDLTPGTGYAITTLTKYILMLLGGIIGCSLIGIEWSKIQWLIAALGVGLGFGLQEIFANFISGIMILFEKPIRIGDTITIRNLTGNVTRINTRATTITDWDHKEIIVPNKEFITKQFINWSLSDTITRVVLKIPGPTKINAKKMTSVLFQIIKNSSLALNTPPPEVYLSDLQQGFPIFEIRIYVSDTKLRMPLCHQIHLLITEYYQKNGIELPCLLNHIYKNQFTNIDKFPLY